MNDELIFSDNDSVFITLVSKVKPWVKWFLISLNILIYGTVITVLASLSEEEVMSAVFPSMMFSAAMFWYVTRPTLWNALGRESIVITRDSLSYYRDFGLFKTNVQNVSIQNGLSAHIEERFTYEDKPYVIITFWEVMEQDELREIVTTAIKTPKVNFKKITDLLDELFKEDESPYEFSVN